MTRYRPEDKDPYEYAELPKIRGKGTRQSTRSQGGKISRQKAHRHLSAVKPLPKRQRSAIAPVPKKVSSGGILLKVYSAVQRLFHRPAIPTSSITVYEPKNASIVPVTEQEAKEYAIEMALYMRPC